jgi:peptide alpha-N-acetyltransferase
MCPLVLTSIILMASIRYRQYLGEADLPHIMALVQNELSEPYVVYTFRYFLHQW